MINTMLLAALVAFGSPPEPDEHRFRVHADLSPLAKTWTWSDGSQSTEAGLSRRGPLRLGFGARVHRVVMLGATASAAFHSSRYTGGEAPGGWTDHAFVAGPYAEVRPMPAARVQPFILARVGASYRGSTRSIPFTNTKVRDVGLHMGAEVGAHAFVWRRVSIDFAASVGGGWLFGRTQDWASSEPPTKERRTGLAIATRLGLSAWL